MKKKSLMAGFSRGCLVSGIFMLLLNVSLHAQTKISGIVMDNINNVPIEAANIIIPGTNIGTYSLEDGSFELIIREKLPIKIAVTYVGYELKELMIPEATDNLLISLEPGALVGQKIVVSASRKREKVQEAPSAVDVIDERVLRADAVINPFLSLRNRVGLDVVQTGANNGHITLRGRTSAFQTETFVMADYRNLVLPGLGVMSYNQQPIDPIDLERVEIVKGPGSALYGPGVEAGIIHFISKSPFDLQGTTVSIGGGTQNTFQASLRHAGTSYDKKFGYKFTGYYRRADDWEADLSDPVDSLRLASYQPQIRSSVTGEVIADGALNYNLESYGFVGTLVYKPEEDISITAQGGYSLGRGIFRTGQGEGYNEIPRPFGQIRIQAGNFFGQAFYSSYNGDDGKSFLYSTGLTTIYEGEQLEGQLQYSLDFDEERYNFIFGVDYRLNTADTKGTVNGRWESNDDFTIIGAYLQSEIKLGKQVDLVGAARLDQFTALETFAFSPRLGLVYRPTPKHTLRWTFNRSFGTPSSINLFADLPIANNGLFLTYLVGGAEPITFNNIETTSLIPGIEPTSGIGMDLQSSYATVTAQLADLGLIDDSMLAYLNGMTKNISGSSPGQLTQNFRERDRLKLSSTTMYEFGYKGLFADKIGITVDLYYNQRDNLFSTPFQASPFVVQPSLADDLTQAISSELDPNILSSLGWTREQVLELYTEAAQNIAANSQTGALNLLGVVQSDQAPEGYPSPTLDVTYYNTGKLDYLGLDFALKYYFSDEFRVFGSFSWLSQVLFEDLELGNDNNSTIDYSLNIPDLKYKFGLEYTPELGFNGFINFRRQEGWFSNLGLPWTGTVDPFNILDIGVGYSFNENLNANLTVTNALNAEYRGFYGAPKIGRQIIAKVYYHFNLGETY